MADTNNQTVPAATPLEGKTVLDDKVRFEPQRLSYECSNRIAGKIASKIENKISDREVVLIDTTVLTDLTNLNAVYLEMQQLETDYGTLSRQAEDLKDRRASRPEPVEEAVPPGAVVAARGLVVAPLAAVTAASTLVNAGLGLVSLFRKDVELHGVDTAIDGVTFSIELGNHLLPFVKKVWIADLSTPLRSQEGKESLHTRLSQIHAAKATAWGAVAPFISQLIQLDRLIEKALATQNQARLDELTTEVSDLRRDLQPITEPLSRTDKRLAEMEKLWLQVDPASGLTVLARLLRAECLSQMGVMFLHAAIVASGGHSRTVRSLWRTIWNRDPVSFTGGAVARWALLDEDRSLLAGGMDSDSLTSCSE